MIFELLQRPFVQGVLFVLVSILLTLVTGRKSAEQAWTLAGYVFMAFILVNSLLILAAGDAWRYFFYSLACSVLYLVCIAVSMPVLIKLLKMQGSEEAAMVFIYIVYHPLLLLLMVFLKWAFLKVWH